MVLPSSSFNIFKPVRKKSKMPIFEPVSDPQSPQKAIHEKNSG